MSVDAFHGETSSLACVWSVDLKCDNSEFTVVHVYYGSK